MAATEKPGPLEVGQKFLKYTIREQIGRGGHAWVYHGHDPFLDNEVAIKILHRHGGVTEDMLRRGQAEAKLLFRLRHPNIVEVQDAGISDDGLLYIVMELLRGKSLRDVMRERGPLPLRETLDLFLDMTNGVEAAHAFGAIHRDLKPENIFILGDGTCKILDFGIAKVVDAAGITTERDVLHGTILYISPEQLEGNRATPRSDLYALGLVFFETLHGRHPLLLKGANPTVRELSLMQIGLRPPRLDELDANIPRHVARIVERLLMKSPKQRMQSTHELRAALAESQRRITEDDLSAPADARRSVTDRIPMAQDTERIPLARLPDRTTSHPPQKPAPAEPIGAAEPMPARFDSDDSSDATPLKAKHRRPAQIARSAPPVTAPPLTTPVRQKVRPDPRSERDLPHQRAARALAAGAVVGVCLGAGYLWFHVWSASREIVSGPHAPTSRPNKEPPAAATVPDSSPGATASAVVASATLDLDAAPGPGTSPDAPTPATSRPLPATNRGKTRRGSASSTSDALLLPDGEGNASTRTHHEGHSAGTPRDDSAARPGADAGREVWIE